MRVNESDERGTSLICAKNLTVVEHQSTHDSDSLNDEKRIVFQELYGLQRFKTKDWLYSVESRSSKQLLLGTCIFYVYLVNHARFIIKEALLERRVGCGKYLYRQESGVL